MSWQKNVWENGDIISVDDLNHLEVGADLAIQNNVPQVLVVHDSITTYKGYICGKLDKTFREIFAALNQGKIVVLSVEDLTDCSFNVISGSLFLTSIHYIDEDNGDYVYYSLSFSDNLLVYDLWNETMGELTLDDYPSRYLPSVG